MGLNFGNGVENGEAKPGQFYWYTLGKHKQELSANLEDPQPTQVHLKKLTRADGRAIKSRMASAASSGAIGSATIELAQDMCTDYIASIKNANGPYGAITTPDAFATHAYDAAIWDVFFELTGQLKEDATEKNE